jgi:hypothetical protein
MSQPNEAKDDYEIFHYHTLHSLPWHLPGEGFA